MPALAERIFSFMNKLNKVFSLFSILFVLSAFQCNAKKSLRIISPFYEQTGSGSSLSIPVHPAVFLYAINTDCIKNLSPAFYFSRGRSDFYSDIMLHILNLFQSGITVFISIYSSIKYRNKFLSSVSFTETVF